MESAIYDFYGCRVYVEGLRLKKAIDKEYWRFKVNEQYRPTNSEIDLYIKPANSTSSVEFLTKPAGSKRGIYMPFKESENTIYYEPNVALDYILSFLEKFLTWEDKTLLHSAAVSKNGKAYIFCGAADVGKTSVVLNLIRRNFDYLSDDWLIVGNRQAYPFPKTVHIFNYNLKDPTISKKALGLKRYFYKPLFKSLDIAEAISPHRYLRYLVQVLISLMIFAVDVEDLGSGVKVGEVCPISKVYYLERQSRGELLLADMKAEELARRMVMVSMYESIFFFEEYFKYAAKYNIKNKKVEDRLEFDFNIYHETFKDAEIHKVMIPLNFDLSTMEDLPLQLGLE